MSPESPSTAFFPRRSRGGLPWCSSLRLPSRSYLVEQVQIVTTLDFSSALILSLKLAGIMLIFLLLTLLYAVLPHRRRGIRPAPRRRLPYMAHTDKKHWKIQK